MGDEGLKGRHFGEKVYWTPWTVIGYKQDLEGSKAGGEEQGRARATQGFKINDQTGDKINRYLNIKTNEG